MRVLVGCEYSGRVRDAFLALGHDAVSVDLLPTEAPGPHIVADVRDAMGDGWDLGIFHPPCTYLTKAGARWLGPTAPDPEGRRVLMAEDAALFRACLDAPIPMVAVENPTMLHEARGQIGRAPDCIIEPYEFGDLARKRTCLWLRGLPPLMATFEGGSQAGDWCVEDLGETADRWKDRSRTFPGFAAAMADQWGGVCAAPELAGV